ncbi:hypothetical protein D3872_23710 [Massilia cavernae]|uniref:Transposase Tn5 dimerisation domain-containing protein n=1 Tax=Massilia cavernae TaxID=2320864 RepID=A0A418X7L4_9BURK|nr:hypothetical protein D3872_24825 [Massilia cavernae]RJG08482.1 hypothetical protein D3872_23710 [Massilia cavernae]
MAEPTASVHKACNGWGETMAAYRFFDNEALYLVVAWRIAHLMRMGRTCPDPDANLFFDPNEIQAAYLLNKAPAPPVPRLNEVVRMIARIGGFLARKSDGEPGAETIWEGCVDVRASAPTIKTLHEMGLLSSCV